MSGVLQTATAQTNAPRRSSPWKIVWRVFSWGTIALGVLTIVLMLHKAAPPEVKKDPGAANRLEEKLHRAEASAAAGVPPVLRVDEAEVNSFLDTHLALDREGAAPAAAANTKEPTLEEVQSTVRDVKIHLMEDRVHAYIVFNFHGKDMTLELEGRLHGEGGYLRFDPVSGKIGALPIPQSTLETAVRKMMELPENREKMRLPDELADLRVENGEIVVAYK
jgi:hypothetical protein